jgi:hypothetical protein
MADNETDVDVFEQEDDGAPVRVDDEWVDLPSIGLLSVAEADALLRWRAANLITIVGERNGGKTTLVTEIYNRFLRGPFADRLYCDSRTLAGFEQKGFQARMASGLAAADTRRTSARDGLRFFHLATAPAMQPAHRTDLLISERAGETYRQVRDQPARAADLVEICKCTNLVFIVDGARVANRLMRPEAFASVRNMMRAFLSGNVLPANGHVQIVTTKYDLLDQLEDAPAALSGFETNLSRMFPALGDRLSFWHVAARDPSNRLPVGWNVAPLFASWMRQADRPVHSAPPSPVLISECDRLLLRREVA